MENQTLINRFNSFLQDPDSVRFDDDTGQPYQIDVEHQALVGLQEDLHKWQDLHKTINTPGWKYLREFLQTQVEYYKNALVLEEDFSKIPQHQAQVLAYKSFFDFIFFIQSKAQLAAEKLTEISQQPQ